MVLRCNYVDVDFQEKHNLIKWPTGTGAFADTSYAVFEHNFIAFALTWHTIHSRTALVTQCQ